MRLSWWNDPCSTSICSYARIIHADPTFSDTNRESFLIRFSLHFFTVGILLLLRVGSLAAQTDLDPVFSEPTFGEITNVLADWVARPTIATQFTHERTTEVDGFTVTRASFVYDGLKQYGLVRFPRYYSSGSSFPVLVLHHGGEQGLYYLDGVNFDQTFPSGCLADSAFVLMPTYRGEAFAGSTALGNRFSEGDVSLWDRDCDDAMAMLTAFLAVTPEADPDRIISMGRSRGATVAYHMALRDPRVRRSVILFGASDFRHPDIQVDCDREVNEGIEATNTLSRKVMAKIVWPWLNGDESLAEVRQLIIGWSIYYFLNENLHLQLHHGQLDSYIPIDHALQVDQKMTGWGAGPPEYDFFSYPLAGHNTTGMTGYEERVEGYLCHLPETNLSAVPLPEVSFQLKAWPNPFTGQIRFELGAMAPDKSVPDAMELRIIDLRGRLVRRLTEPSFGTSQFLWDGLDSQGMMAPAGVYLVEANNPGLQTGVENGISGKRIIKLR